MNTPAVDFVALLVADSAGQLYGSNTSENLSAGSGFCTDFQRGAFQYFDYLVYFSQQFFLFLLLLFDFLIQLFEVGRTRFNRLFLWNQEITCITILNTHLFMGGAKIIHVLNQNDFHYKLFCPPARAGRNYLNKSVT